MCENLQKRRISPTDVSTFMNCPLGAYEQRVLQIYSGDSYKSVEMDRGSWFGKLIERLANGLITLEEFSLAAPTSVGQAKGFAAARALVKARGGAPDICEVKLEQNTPTGKYLLVAKLDAIDVTSRVIEEFKITQCKEMDEYWRTVKFNVQIPAYWYAGVLNGFEPECVRYTVIQQPDLRLKKSESVTDYSQRLLENSEIHSKDFKLSEADVVKGMEVIEQVADWIYESKVFPVNAWNCGRCSRKGVCSAF